VYGQPDRSVEVPVITPSPKGDGFLGDACLSPATLPPTGPIRASQAVELGGSLPGRVATESRRSSLVRAGVDPSAPTGLGTSQAYRGDRHTQSIRVASMFPEAFTFINQVRTAKAGRRQFRRRLKATVPLPEDLWPIFAYPQSDRCVTSLEATPEFSPW
jgi:hypothetical protein